MKPYRDLFPHADLLLPNTITIANKVIVLPSGTTLKHEWINTIVAIISMLAGRATS
jgi:dTDP-4-amino-4,6-dideoxygalactose transaminase